MALTKDKKREVVDEVSKLLQSSKLTVVTKYQGTTVKALQTLRKEARKSDTHVQVIKNRLVIKALQQSETLKSVDTKSLQDMLLYAFNPVDEAAPAQCIAQFAKQNPSLEFVGAITADGMFMSADDVKALALLPGKDQLRAILAGTLSAPLTGFVNVLLGNIRGVLNVLNARAESL